MQQFMNIQSRYVPRDAIVDCVTLRVRSARLGIIEIVWVFFLIADRIKNSRLNFFDTSIYYLSVIFTMTFLARGTIDKRNHQLNSLSQISKSYV